MQLGNVLINLKNMLITNLHYKGLMLIYNKL